MRWWMFAPCLNAWPAIQQHAGHEHVCLRETGQPHVCTCALCEDPAATLPIRHSLGRVGNSLGGVW